MRFDTYFMNGSPTTAGRNANTSSAAYTAKSNVSAARTSRIATGALRRASICSYRHPGILRESADQPTAISSESANGGTSSMRSPLQKRPGSYQLAGLRFGSRPMCW